MLRKYSGWYRNGNKKYHFEYTQKGDKTVMQRWDDEQKATVDVKITSDLKPFSVFEGENVSLSVGVSSSLPLTYEWSKNNILMDNKNSETLDFPSARQSDEAIYQLTIRQGGDYLRSRKVAVIVVKKPDISLNKDANGNENPFDINENMTDNSIKKISKYKWIDAGGGNYKLKVTLQVKYSPSISGIDSVSSKAYLGDMQKNSKSYFEGVKINKQQGSISPQVVGMFATMEYEIKKAFTYQKDPAPWNSRSFLKHYFFGKGVGVIMKEIGLADGYEKKFNSSEKHPSKGKDFIIKQIELSQNEGVYQGAGKTITTNHQGIISGYFEIGYAVSEYNPLNKYFPLGRVNIGAYWKVLEHNIVGLSSGHVNQYKIQLNYNFPNEYLEQPFDVNADFLYDYGFHYFITGLSPIGIITASIAKKIRYAEPGTPFKIDHDWNEKIIITDD